MTATKVSGTPRSPLSPRRPSPPQGGGPHLRQGRAPRAARVPRSAPPLLLVLCLLSSLLAAPGSTDAGVEGGSVRCYVFGQDGRPVKGIEAEVAGRVQVSDRHGVVRFRLPAGKHVVTLKRDGGEVARISVPIVRREVTEVIVTVGRKGQSPDVDIEAAEGAAAVPLASPGDGQEIGNLSGRVVDLESKEPVAGARIFLRGVDAETRTDAKGFFSRDLPAGAYALSVIHPDYATETVEGVTVGVGEELRLDLQMTPASLELDAFTVTAIRIEGGIASLMEEQRESADVIDVIGAEQIAKSGDSTAASALQRVTGLTVVDGKYVYVRGMGERYSSSLLNGATLPSPEPERRVVPLDLFPVEVLESISIRKTYSPDLPAEFGGGAVVMRTRGLPERFMASAKFSVGYREGTTFEDGLTYEGGSWDFLGFDDGARALPDSVREASDQGLILPKDQFTGKGFTQEQLRELGLSMPNVWSPERKTVPPNFSISGTIGNRFEPWGRPLGVLFSFTYKNKWATVDDRRLTTYKVGAGGQLEEKDYRDFLETANDVDISAILDIDGEISENHNIKLTSLLIRTTLDETRVYEGPYEDEATDIRVSRLWWVERMLFSQQVKGSHAFPDALDLGLDWNYTFSLARRHEPDRRDTRYDLDPDLDAWLISDRPEGNQMLYSDLTDHNHDLSLALSLPFEVWSQLKANVKLGGGLILRDREVDTRRFSFLAKGDRSQDPAIRALPPEQIFVPANVGPQGWVFEEVTLQTDNYTAKQHIYAGYLMTTLPILRNLSLNAGVRVEQSGQEVTTFAIFSPTPKEEKAELDTTDIVPALALTWEFLEDMQLRAGYSQTVNRPDFRELSPAVFNDVIGGRQFKGNPDLDRALLHNFDLRWEWYLSASEQLSVGAFYKEIEDPIENTIIPGSTPTYTLQNVASAHNYGVEVAFRKDFSFFGDFWQDFYLSGNFAYIESSVELGSAANTMTSSERPLQGQSPYVINVTAGYDNVDTETYVAVLFNVFGRRISDVGTDGLPDIYEEPFEQLDLVATQGLGKGCSLKLKAKNLLDSGVDFTQGGRPYDTFTVGRELELSFTWRY